MEKDNIPVNIENILNSNQNKKPKEYGIPFDQRSKKNYLFASFDLCNSTELKRTSKYWFDVISNFLASYNHLTDMECWKFNGDEILFFEEVTTIFEVISLLSEVFHKMGEIQDILIKAVRNRAGRLENIKYEESAISIKGAIWIAQTHNINFKDENVFNYRFEINNTEDFSGINIDEGFRLRNWSSRQKLLIDPKIVSILYIANQYFENRKTWNIKALSETECGEFINRANKFDSKEGCDKIKETLEYFKIMGYQPCKGVWDGHLYPIIWYAENWELFQNNILYDEKFDGEYVINILERDKELSQIYNVDYLIEILAQVDELDTIKDILNTLYFYKEKGMPSPITRHLNNSANLYYMVMCVNCETQNVLLFKRSDMRKHLRGVWDFGNIKHKSVEERAMADIIEQEYKENFDLDITVVRDLERDAQPIYPLALCSVPRYGKIHNGVLCVATINNIKTEKEIINTIKKRLDKDREEHPSIHKYSDVMFVADKMFEDGIFKELTIDEIKDDSKNAASGNTFLFGENGQAITINNCRNSIRKAIKYIESKEV